jgi:hypothetical protein
MGNVKPAERAGLQQIWITFGWQAGSEYPMLTPNFVGWSLAKRDHVLL